MPLNLFLSPAAALHSAAADPPAAPTTRTDNFIGSSTSSWDRYIVVGASWRGRPFSSLIRVHFDFVGLRREDRKRTIEIFND